MNMELREEYKSAVKALSTSEAQMLIFFLSGYVMGIHGKEYGMKMVIEEIKDLKEKE